MIEIRPSRLEDIPAQKTLWKLCFGDGDAFIEMFYQRYSKPEDVMVLLEDGVLRSMATLLPMELHFPDGSTGKAGYVYALCTHPESRKQGFIRELLNYCDYHLKQRGADCISLVPAEASLHRFFGLLGYSECFSHRKFEMARNRLPAAGEGDTALRVEPEEYGRIREELLDGLFHVSYGAELLAFQQDFSQMLGGGGLYRIQAGDLLGCAVVESLREGSLLVKELLLSRPEVGKAMAALAKAMPAAYYNLRAPSFYKGLTCSYIQAFGMVKWYNTELERRWGRDRQGYMGLGFD